MNVAIWLPATFLLGLAGLGLCYSDASGFREVVLIYFTAIITALAFVYLVTAMIRPEWF
jgi:F subunit of K+-transporting ATPase